MLKREHLLDYMMKGHIHLSKKDYGFYNNLNYIVREKKKVTSNQNALFEKLLAKYQRQLRKQGLELDALLKLKWDVETVDSSEEYLIPRLYLKNDVLHLRTPFNSKFITAFKRDNHTFSWHPDDKVYKSQFYTHSFRVASDLCNQFFGRVEYCNELQKLLEPLKLFDGLNFEPTLVCKSGNYYISNINESLYNATKHIELDGSFDCLFQLSLYGIKIDNDITQEDPFLLFASEFNVTMDLDVLLSNVDYFKKLKVDAIVFHSFFHDNSVDKVIKQVFEGNGIMVSKDTKITGNVFFIRRTRSLISPRINFKELGTMSSDILHTMVNKVIDVTNSRPIEVK